MDRKRIVVSLLMLLLVVMLILGAGGCGAKKQNGNGNGSEDQPLSPVERSRESESILFLRNDNPAIYTSENERYFIIDKPGNVPVRIEKELPDDTIKAPDGNSLAYLSWENDYKLRALNLYDIDTGTTRVFQIADTIEEVSGIPLSGLRDFSWAPDGRSVYISVYPVPDARSVYIPIPLLFFRYYLDDGSCTEISLEHPGIEVSLSKETDGLYSVDSIDVSPSGTRIIVNTFWCGDLYQQSVRNIKRIIPEPSGENGQIYPHTSPIWLNNNEVTYIEGPERNLIKLDVDTGIMTIVLKSTPEMELGWAPRAGGISLACSPEGGRILFPVITDSEKYAEAETCISPLYIINADGTGLVQVTNPEKEGVAWGDTWPCWASR